MVRLGDLVDVLHEWFDPRWAESWDAVGLVCGDRDEQVQRVVLAVDPVPATVAETIERGAQLLVTHHPLLLTPVHGVPADGTLTRLVHRMIRAGLGHLVAHTNADVADPGVSDALGAVIGLGELTPLVAQADPPLVKLVVFVPPANASALLDALAVAGAGAIGDYDRCAWSTVGQGTFRPLAGAAPVVGQVGEVSELTETRLEMVMAAVALDRVVSALRATHPYEEPAFDLLVQRGAPTGRGTGRVGELPSVMTLAEFTAHVARSLPATRWGVRAAGDPLRPIRRVAVCGGSGGGYAEAALAAGADVLLTADLKHHLALDATTDERRSLALVDAAHWATEAPWLDALADRLGSRFGTMVEVHVSRIVTDPWTVHSTVPPATPEASSTAP
jgi:dinuclear metal center YbgI/SA1388 family protein